MELQDQILDSWRIAAGLNLFLLEALSADQLALKASKGKSVGGQFAHIHNVRLMWIKASAPELMGELVKLEESASREELAAGLSASAAAVGLLIAKGLDEGRIKNFKPHPAGFVGYLIAHEASHRGQAELILRLSGQPVSDKVGYGLWEWGARAT